MPPDVHLVINVDSDPDPVSVYQDDASLLKKYGRMRRILAEHAGGAAAWTVLTGPVCRDRFFEPPFTDFWRELVGEGADLVLHPEEDLYGPPPGKEPGSCTYYDIAHMRPLILGKAEAMRGLGLPFAAYRGGYHGFTPEIGAVVKEAGIGIELSCAPGIAWLDKAAAWEGAPLSAYYMSATIPARPAAPGETGALFEIPWAWDAKAPGTARPRVVGENYIINEFSNLPAMSRVWDAVVARAQATPEPQIVSMVCHTFTMGQPEYEERLTGILDYVAENGGRFVTPSTARHIFDECRAASGKE
ncbi:hypothetical protein DWF00_14940 [Bosea caraganae]|uniref:Polysaccharide deacetylase n=1 Tax=Bosea caraganae TaxID=2763117 RepID=A0A370L6Y8_9HYPH|nr:hypothetical protein [Bosea caraganae]RDJ25520.1 hypothetical protein DWE98_12445 [Bosea caraganae]RDJ25693.1 hypothetical protein DWF00_14940 [Bosea caraganae]